MMVINKFLLLHSQVNILVRIKSSFTKLILTMFEFSISSILISFLLLVTITSPLKTAKANTPVPLLIPHTSTLQHHPTSTLNVPRAKTPRRFLLPTLLAQLHRQPRNRNKRPTQQIRKHHPPLSLISLLHQSRSRASTLHPIFQPPLSYLPKNNNSRHLHPPPKNQAPTKRPRALPRPPRVRRKRYNKYLPFPPISQLSNPSPQSQTQKPTPATAVSSPTPSPPPPSKAKKSSSHHTAHSSAHASLKPSPPPKIKRRIKLI